MMKALYDIIYDDYRKLKLKFVKIRKFNLKRYFYTKGKTTHTLATFYVTAAFPLLYHYFTTLTISLPPLYKAPTATLLPSYHHITTTTIPPLYHHHTTTSHDYYYFTTFLPPLYQLPTATFSYPTTSIPSLYHHFTTTLCNLSTTTLPPLHHFPTTFLPLPYHKHTIAVSGLATTSTPQCSVLYRIK